MRFIKDNWYRLLLLINVPLLIGINFTENTGYVAVVTFLTCTNILYGLWVKEKI